MKDASKTQLIIVPKVFTYFSNSFKPIFQIRLNND